MQQDPCESGKLITLYGINNLGKTTQAKLLQERITGELRLRTKYIKYAIYDLKPTGPEINSYLRSSNPRSLSPREFQLLQILNRTHYDETMRGDLSAGIQIIAEDYWATGVAWGMAAGVDRDFLICLNERLVKENIAVLLDGQRFSESIEDNHGHESRDKLTEKSRLAHLELAEMFDWPIVGVNRPELTPDQAILEVHEEVWSIVSPLFKT